MGNCLDAYYYKPEDEAALAGRDIVSYLMKNKNLN